MSVIIKTGSRYSIGSEADIQILEKLPPKPFVVRADMSGLFLNQISDFDIPPKLYGSTNSDADRIIAAFDHRPVAMGVHMDGMKGSGKTLLAKVVSQKMAARGAPTILVNEPFNGDGFNSFIQNIHQESVVIFDEFEKIFNAEQQSKILSLLDGVYPSRKLFLITTNEDRKVSDYMKNRPGRVYYKLSFDRLQEDFIRDFVDDTLRNKEHRKDLLIFTKMYPNLNFDMLSALVNEMNNFNEPVKQALRFLNVKPEQIRTYSYDMRLTNEEGVTINLGVLEYYDPMNFCEEISSSHIFTEDAIKFLKEIPVEDIEYFFEDMDKRTPNTIDSKKKLQLARELFLSVDNEDAQMIIVKNHERLLKKIVWAWFIEAIRSSYGTYSVEFNTEHLVDMDVDKDIYIYETTEMDKKYNLALSRHIYKKINKWDFF